jgi:lipopolysaccharide transport system permease protein
LTTLEDVRSSPTAAGHAKPVHGAVPTLRIEPARGIGSLGLKELWAYKELVYFFAWRDIKVRYKQTVLGAGWAIVQPLATMIVFSVFFGRLAKVGSDGVPYPVFSYAALVPWMFFSNGLAQGANSLVGNANLLTKVYFPRLALPISSLATCVVDFLLSFLGLVGLMMVFGIEPSSRLLFLPAFALLALVTLFGVSLWLAAINVEYRDVRQLVPFLTQFWMFATPIVYSSSIVPEQWRVIYGLNPMVGVVEGFRWALLGINTAPGPMVMASSAVALLVLVSGLYYFRRMERTFADVV